MLILRRERLCRQPLNKKTVVVLDGFLRLLGAFMTGSWSLLGVDFGGLGGVLGPLGGVLGPLGGSWVNWRPT